MKKIILLLIIFSCQQLSAQTGWTASNNLQATPYGNSDSINLSATVGSATYYFLDYLKFDYSSNSVLQQPMKTNLMVINDSLYLIDSSKLVNPPTSFYSKSITTDSLQVALETTQLNNLMIPPGLNPNRYDDENNNLQSYYGPDILKDYAVKLNLGHYSQLQNKVISYKSIHYRIQSISNTSVNYSPNWQSSALLPDSAMTAPNNSDFFINIENNKIVFYHASKISNNCYNLNLSQISNDSIYVDLHPSRLLNLVFPLASSFKTLATDYSNSPRFIVADCNDFTDSLTIGYHYEHILNDASPLQAFDWITVYKQTNNTISYTTFNPQILNVSTPVPYKELKLSVTQSTVNNTINWVSIGSDDIAYFELQRSTNGIDFENIHTVKSSNLGSPQEEYTYDDYDLKSKLYYRIKAVDLDNNVKYSYTVFVNRVENIDLVISPNPTTGILNIQRLAPTAYTIKVITLDGKIVLKETHETPNNTVKIDISNLPRSVYTLQLTELETNQIITKKIMKE